MCWYRLLIPFINKENWLYNKYLDIRFIHDWYGNIRDVIPFPRTPKNAEF